MNDIDFFYLEQKLKNLNISPMYTKTIIHRSSDTDVLKAMRYIEKLEQAYAKNPIPEIANILKELHDFVNANAIPSINYGQPVTQVIFDIQPLPIPRAAFSEEYFNEIDHIRKREADERKEQTAKEQEEKRIRKILGQLVALYLAGKIDEKTVQKTYMSINKLSSLPKMDPHITIK